MDKRTVKIDQVRLKLVLNYSPLTGYFNWAHNKQLSVGHINKKGCHLICVYGKIYYAKDLAYLWMMGNWPDDEIVFYDGDQLNHAWDNLELRKIMRCKPLMFQRVIGGIKKYSYSILLAGNALHGVYSEDIEIVKNELLLEIKNLHEKKPAFAG